VGLQVPFRRVQDRRPRFRGAPFGDDKPGVRPTVVWWATLTHHPLKSPVRHRRSRACCSGSLFWRAHRVSAPCSQDRSASSYRHPRTGYIAAVIRRQQYIHRRKLHRLTGPMACRRRSSRPSPPARWQGSALSRRVKSDDKAFSVPSTPDLLVRPPTAVLRWPNSVPTNVSVW
jgi:hypothetical protein